MPVARRWITKDGATTWILRAEAKPDGKITTRPVKHSSRSCTTEIGARSDETQTRQASPARNHPSYPTELVKPTRPVIFHPRLPEELRYHPIFPEELRNPPRYPIELVGQSRPIETIQSKWNAPSGDELKISPERSPSHRWWWMGSNLHIWRGLDTRWSILVANRIPSVHFTYIVLKWLGLLRHNVSNLWKVDLYGKSNYGKSNGLNTQSILLILYLAHLACHNYFSHTDLSSTNCTHRVAICLVVISVWRMWNVQTEFCLPPKLTPSWIKTMSVIVYNLPQQYLQTKYVSISN